MDRKRRLTATSHEDRTPPRRPSGLEPSSSRAEHNRPLPLLPHDGHETPPGAPGSTQENAINLLSSPSLPDPNIHSRRPSNTISTPSQPSQNLMEYTLPRWQPDSEVTHCPICDTHFSFWYRKHHCRKCGRVVCASCSPHRITIPRQYIVRPPESIEEATPERLPRRHRYSASFVDLTTDTGHDTGHDSSPVATRVDSYHPSNPALGGGEEVRLCNPCVPDPNPDPPLAYSAVRASFDRLADPNWATTMPSLPVGHPLHRSHRSVSGPYVSSSRTDADRDSGRYRHQNNYTANFPSHQTSSDASFGQHIYPSRYAFPFDFHPSHSPPSPSSAREISYFLSGHQSGPASSNFRSAFSTNPRNRPGHSRSVMDYDRPRHLQQSYRTPIDERDICPICSMRLPPRGSDGNEDDREAHIRVCIQNSSRMGRSPPGSSPPQSPPHPLRMIFYTATEKDCANEDGTPQECTICMEEYEVGDKLARLECLCKFHKLCIVEWSDRKKECPVHKFS